MTLFFKLLDGLAEKHHSVLPALRPYLPRPRLLHSLLCHAFSSFYKPGARVDTAYSVDDEAHTDRHWYYFFCLEESALYGSRRCSLRKDGCLRKGVRRCKGCDKARYCSRECQKRLSFLRFIILCDRRANSLSQGLDPP